MDRLKPDGTETTVSLKHLTPKGYNSTANQPSDVISQSEVCDTQSLESVISPTPEQSVHISSPPVLRRSTHVSKPPSRYY